MKNILILQHVTTLRDKPYMIINKIEGYHTYESFLNGFFRGIDLLYEVSISNDFSTWVGDFFKVENTNTHWTSFLRIEFKEKTDEYMIKCLFELVIEFFNQTEIMGNDTDTAH